MASGDSRSGACWIRIHLHETHSGLWEETPVEVVERSDCIQGNFVYATRHTIVRRLFQA